MFVLGILFVFVSFLRIEQIQAYLSKHPPPPNLTQGYTLKELYQNPDKISSINSQE